MSILDRSDERRKRLALILAVSGPPRPSLQSAKRESDHLARCLAQRAAAERRLEPKLGDRVAQALKLRRGPIRRQRHSAVERVLIVEEPRPQRRQRPDLRE